jgi:hypothetical protein
VDILACINRRDVPPEFRKRKEKLVRRRRITGVEGLKRTQKKEKVHVKVITGLYGTKGGRIRMMCAGETRRGLKGFSSSCLDI